MRNCSMLLAHPSTLSGLFDLICIQVPCNVIFTHELCQVILNPAKEDGTSSRNSKERRGKKEPFFNGRH